MKSIIYNTWNGNDYITVVMGERIQVFRNDDENIYMEISREEGVNSAVFADALYYTKEHKNIIKSLSGNTLKEDTLDEYSMVKIRKCLDIDRGWFLLEVKDSQEKGNISRIIIYDMKEREEVLCVPFSNGFLDAALYGNNMILQLTNHWEDCSVYQDDDDEMQYKVVLYPIEIAREYYLRGEEMPSKKLKSYIGIFSSEAWEGGYRSQEIGRNMHFSLFNMYGYHWPQPLSVSADTNFIYWTDDYHGICCCDVKSSESIGYWVVPGQFSSKKSLFFYNEEKKYLYIFDKKEGLFVYRLSQDEQLLAEVNRLYNRAHEMRQVLSRERGSEFEQKFNKCLYGAQLELLVSHNLVTKD